MSAHVQVPKQEEGQKPVRGEVSLPKQVAAEDKSIILVFAKVIFSIFLIIRLGWGRCLPTGNCIRANKLNKQDN